MGGWIYIAENNKDKGKDLYKVGFTTNLKQRLEALNSSGVSGKINWHKTYSFPEESLRKIERRIHNEISRNYPREPGKEWFHCPVEIIEKIIEKIERPSIKFDWWDEKYYDDGVFDYLFSKEKFSFVELSTFLILRERMVIFLAHIHIIIKGHFIFIHIIIYFMKRRSCFNLLMIIVQKSF